MKNKKICPKCNSTEIAIAIGKSGTWVNTIATGKTIFSTVPCEKYICLKCGYIEQYVTNEEGIKKIAKKCYRI